MISNLSEKITENSNKKKLMWNCKQNYDWLDWWQWAKCGQDDDAKAPQGQGCDPIAWRGRPTLEKYFNFQFNSGWQLTI